MTKVSIVTPVYNESENITNLVQRVNSVFKKLTKFKYEHIIIDNDSTDDTFKICVKLAHEFPNLIIIRNFKNFGFSKSSFYALKQATGDCAIFLMADLQDPPELIPAMISMWEKGISIVACVKTSSNESRIMYFLRSKYYAIMKALTNGQHIEHFTGFGLYDRKFLDIINSFDDSTPYLRGMVYEYGFAIKKLEYKQDKRKKGVTKFSFWGLLDLAILGVVSSSKVPLRLMVLSGLFSAVIFFIIGLVYLIMKLLYWDSFQSGVAGIVVSVFFIGSIQLMMIGLIGEYVGVIFNQTRKRPLVIERERFYSDVNN